MHIRALITLFSRATPTRKIIAVIALLGLLVGAIWPDDSAQLEGTVVGVADGDTITVLDAGLQQHKIRFAFVDAPEKAQPFGMQAKQVLSEKVYLQHVRVKVLRKDRYGRDVGRVWLGGEDVNLAQLQAGYAWHYQLYAKKGQSSGDYAIYERAQNVAREQRQGLWQDVAPMPPWDFRQQKRMAN